MRRGSRKSSSSAATASAGKRPTPGSLPPSLSSLIGSLVLPGSADRFLFSQIGCACCFLWKIQSPGCALLERTRWFDFSIV
jgi:hypothetical protein